MSEQTITKSEMTKDYKEYHREYYQRNKDLLNEKQRLKRKLKQKEDKRAKSLKMVEVLNMGLNCFDVRTIRNHGIIKIDGKWIIQGE